VLDRISTPKASLRPKHRGRGIIGIKKNQEKFPRRSYAERSKTEFAQERQKGKDRTTLKRIIGGGKGNRY